MKGVKHLDIEECQLEGLVERLEQKCLAPDDYEYLKAIVGTVRYLSQQHQRAATSMKRVLKMIFGASTEKTDDVLKRKSKPEATSGADKPKRKGHGRLAADEYPGAERVHVTHESLRPGEKCPACEKGLIRDTNRPSILMRFCAQPLIKVKAFVIEQLRCSLCGTLFGAKAPPEAVEKYDQNVPVMLAVMRYGFGMPTNRLADLQRMFGVPLPAGTQWGLMWEYYAELGEIILSELTRQAATGSVFHNDDTTARVLAVEAEIRDQQEKATKKKDVRTGVFTTGIVSITEGHKITLFLTGRQHAGENLQKVLDHRPAEMQPPIQMCDGLSRNEPKSQTLKSNCNIHGRREFVEIADKFPVECEHVLETFKQLYKHEAHAVEMKMSPGERLMHHQENSAILMEDFRIWMEKKIEDKQVEPNSGLGSAIQYLLKRWKKLTLFLSVPGVPLDNNLCERILKTSIRHRDCSLYYRNMNGAKVGDFFMSIIQTCRLNGKDPFDYLATLRRFARECRRDPSAWMPWTYQASAAAAAPS